MTTLEEKSSFPSKQLLSPPVVHALRRPFLWQRYDVPESEPEAAHWQFTSKKSAYQAASKENFSVTHSLNAVDNWDKSYGSHEGLMYMADIEDNLPTSNKLIVSSVTETLFEAAEHIITQMNTFDCECCSIVSGLFWGFEFELQQQAATFTAPLLAKLKTLRNVFRIETNTFNNDAISENTITQPKAESYQICLF